MRRKDDHDYTAERIVEEYAQHQDEDALIVAIAKALREAAGVPEPRQLTREEYAAVCAKNAVARKANAS